MTGWDSWQSTWAGASGPLPDVRARAQREASRHRRTQVTVLLLAAIASLGAVPAFAAPEGAVHAIGWAILAFGAAMGIGFLVIQRGVGSWRFAGPREALGFLERRLGAELRMARLVRWVYLGMCLFGGIATQVLYIEHASPLSVRLMTLGCFLFGVTLAFFVPWWFGRIARRRQAELDRWRSWIDEQGL
ncbi:MAG TPA: hypothetical protein VLT82_09130 [Myxococcaceae bacterium]|nr:hypothetical protein [Myxococcaceae bacterium]